MSVLTDLQTARENLATELRIETTARRTAQDAGQGVKTNYTANGRTVDWLGYLKAMMTAIADLDALILATDPYEHVTQAYT